jgi:hypothetical protein
MLDENNLNVLNQVFSFIKAYAKDFPITQIPVEGLISRILNFYNIHVLFIEDIIAIISLKSSRAKIL